MVRGRLIPPHGIVDDAMRTLVIGTPPPNQPLLVTPLGRPLGTDFGDPFGDRGMLGRGRD